MSAESPVTSIAKQRTLWNVHNLDTGEYETDEVVERGDNRERVDDEAKANVVSSLCNDGRHMPVIDLDIPHRYVASSTPGHGHLFLDVPTTWATFEDLLCALYNAGVIEGGFYRLSRKRKAAFVRKPGTFKPSADDVDQRVVALAGEGE